MRKLIFIALSALFLSLSAFADTAQNVKFDLEASGLKWTGKKVTGSHNGTLKLKSANGTIDAANKVTGSFEIDMESLVVSDLESAKDNKKLKDHLKSEDFFNVEEYPTVVFKIVESQPTTDPKSADANVLVKGELSIKGITKSIEFPAKISVSSSKVDAHANVKVDRTLFDVRYGSGKFFAGLGDKLIYDEFEVELDLHGEVL